MAVAFEAPRQQDVRPLFNSPDSFLDSDQRVTVFVRQIDVALFISAIDAAHVGVPFARCDADWHDDIEPRAIVCA